MLRRMWRFYWQLLRPAPDQARITWSQAVFWVSIAIGVLAFVSPELAKQTNAAWLGFPRYLAAIPVIAAVLFRVAHRNFEEFERLQGQFKTDVEKKTARRKIRETLSSFIAECKVYEDMCLSKDDRDLAARIERIKKEPQKFLAGLDDQSFAYLFLMATENDHPHDPQEMRRHDMRDDHYMQALCLFRAKRAVLEKCLEHFPPLH